MRIGNTSTLPAVLAVSRRARVAVAAVLICHHFQMTPREGGRDSGGCGLRKASPSSSAKGVLLPRGAEAPRWACVMWPAFVPRNALRISTVQFYGSLLGGKVLRAIFSFLIAFEYRHYIIIRYTLQTKRLDSEIIDKKNESELYVGRRGTLTSGEPTNTHISIF